ncbi:hypothetical protein H5410_060109 [Solanum commersonii]|uniref:Uncharacterized protein n=1 Tax=Solanum commersonii TaxID=4109 RepID=A0A9J5W4N5_SOLCO|nr:hypothetical protein H5410_060109 [Solanum commersonii]
MEVSTMAVPSSNFGNIYFFVHASDYDDNVLHAFVNFGPSTNTLSTFIERCPYHFGTYNPLEVSPHTWALFDAGRSLRRKELTARILKELLLPQSCRYLFSSFYRLAKDDLQEVSIHDWVKFWFRGPNRYVEPPQKVSKVRATKPRLNHNPSGHIDSNFLPRTDEENALFVELDVEESLRDETN